MKKTFRRSSRHAALMAFVAIALTAGCSTPPGTGFVDPASDDASDDSSGGASGSSGGADVDGSSSSGGPKGPGDAGGKTEASTGCTTSCKVCRGTPASCASRTSDTACAAAGCTWGGMCIGSSLPCPGLNQSLCGVQQNCTYAAGVCSGTAYACNVLSSAYACTPQQGCTWQMACSGAPTACASFADSATCSGAGCTWN
jgi:hypothetical protein